MRETKYYSNILIADTNVDHSWKLQENQNTRLVEFRDK